MTTGIHDDMPKRHSRRMIHLTSLLCVVLLGITACGIPVDEKAHEIPEQVLGTITPSPSTTTPEADGTTQETLYLVRTGDPASSGSERLEAVLVDVPSTDDVTKLPRSVIEALISLAPSDTGQSGAVNALPAGARVLSASVTGDNVLDLNMSGLASVESALQRLAIAQIVFTVTGLTSENIYGVRFSLDGTHVAVPVEEGTKDAGDIVTRNDYPKLRDQVASKEPSPGSG